MAENEQPKLHIDDDWKAQARREKEKLAESQKASPKPGEGGEAPGGFEMLLSTMATQALFAMGGIPDPRTGQRFQNLDVARQQIDLLSVLEEKTRGNLTEEESKLLMTTLYQLRTQYIQLAGAARGQ